MSEQEQMVCADVRAALIEGIRQDPSLTGDMDSHMVSCADCQRAEEARKLAREAYQQLCDDSRAEVARRVDYATANGKLVQELVVRLDRLQTFITWLNGGYAPAITKPLLAQQLFHLYLVLLQLANTPEALYLLPDALRLVTLQPDTLPHEPKLPPSAL